MERAMRDCGFPWRLYREMAAVIFGRPVRAAVVECPGCDSLHTAPCMVIEL